MWNKIVAVVAEKCQSHVGQEKRVSVVGVQLSVGDDGVVQAPGDDVSVVESVALDGSGRYALEGGIL